ILVSANLADPNAWAIVGAGGAIGNVVGKELEKRGIPFRAIGRRAEVLRPTFDGMAQAKVLCADAGDRDALSEALSGTETMLYAIGVPYNKFRLHPKLMRVAVDAAVAAGVRNLIVLSTVYVYGRPQTRPVTEMHPLEPHTFKGRLRLEQEEIAFAAHREGKLRTIVLRPADFYGPRADLSYAKSIVDAALAGKPASLLVPADVPHQFTYVPDLGPIIVDVAGDDRAYGEAYNVGGVTPTVRSLAREIYEQAGAPFKSRDVNTATLRLLGIVNPLMRELVEMQYLNERPVITRDDKLRARLGDIRYTDVKSGIASMLAAARAGSANPS
ncbi:MAG: NAD-dependent epimerase/dehydratase family protein, partial [Candidatus Eremiobacteraeota bacterium]|nr:NAD-dependent epimerase/dehydratase family protein [Candidatus Eremiobacteraeota bacterium]